MGTTGSATTPKPALHSDGLGVQVVCLPCDGGHLMAGTVAFQGGREGRKGQGWAFLAGWWAGLGNRWVVLGA